MDVPIEKKTFSNQKILLLGGGLLIIALIIFVIISTGGGSKLNLEKERITINTVTNAVFQENIPVNGVVFCGTDLKADINPLGNLIERPGNHPTEQAGLKIHLGIGHNNIENRKQGPDQDIRCQFQQKRDHQFETYFFKRVKESYNESEINSELVGKIIKDNVLQIFPNIESGNTFYKSTTFLANSVPAGLVLGATNPIVLTSRADSYKSRLYSIALAVVSTDIL